MSKRISQLDLHRMFIDDLHGNVLLSDGAKKKPLIITVCTPAPVEFKVYLFNCTSPPGGRALDEYKSQLIIEGQKKGEKRILSDTAGRFILLVGVAVPFDSIERSVYVLWDAEAHREFSFSANLQVKLDPILTATTDGIVEYKKKSGEIVVVTQRNRLLDAINRRLNIDLKRLIEV